MRFFQGIHRETGLESTRGQTSKTTLLSRVDHNQKIRTSKQRTDVGKYSFVNRTVRSWNQLPAVLLASLPCSLSSSRKRVTVTSK
jgi:hypothetical protein